MADGDFLRLRKRSGWEASDSGLLLWRRNAGAMLLFFALPYALIVAALCFVPRNSLPWIFPGLWWFKPLLDRLILHVISVRFFEYDAPLSRLVRGLGTSLRAGLAGDLLWRRFSPWRGGRMPVRVLEKLKGKAARKRIAVLGSGGLGFSLTVTMFSIALTGALLSGEIIFTLMAAGVPDMNTWDKVFQIPRAFVVLFAAVNGINFLIVESLYICMSFGIYINSRLETEGWDLQLDFRRFAGGTQNKAVPFKGIAKVLVLAVLLLGLRTHPLYGEDAGSSAGEKHEAVLTEEDALEVLDKVLASPDFGTEEDTWRIQFKQSEQEETLSAIPYTPGKIRRFLSMLIRALAAAAIVAVPVFCLYRYLKTGRVPGKGRGWKNSALAAPEKEKSSALLLEEAREFQSRGLVREAWARCFAAILAAFSERDKLIFPRDATEYGCLGLLRSRELPEAEAFNRFLKCWIGLAYGGRTPDPGRFDEALSFCVSLRGPAGE